MTMVSVAEAARRLGIDVKTLRRWLAAAHLSLHPHPGDGRKQGVSQEQLERLAHLHQRHLLPFSEEPPAPLPGDLPSLPAAGLALSEQLAAFQAQIAGLQRQITELPHLLQSPIRPLPLPTPAAKPARTSRRPPTPVSRSRPTASPPRKPVHVIPRVEYGQDGRYVVICPKQGRLPFEPETEEWFAWVAKQTSFRFVGKQGHFTAHHEWRVLRGAWRAHRHMRNHVAIQRLAPNHELTIAVLEQAAATLQAHLN